ncbi:MAG: helix-hairpin-helix domain-containing protein [Candidatus Omnitrophica bacterium]|nr:helix-hairpin-helix domain-containing protein [Candidatus Omnitrophota bacterium]
MFSFNKQEIITIIVICSVIVIGSILRFTSTRFPRHWQKTELMSGNTCFVKVNVNRASVKDLDNVPNLGLSTAGRIISYRNSHGPFKAVDEIKNIPRVREKDFALFAKYLEVR